MQEIIDNIDNAIVLLKNLKVLYSSKTYFVMKKQKVLIVGLNSKYFLSFEQFKELYKDNKFIVYEENDEKNGATCRIVFGDNGSRLCPGAIKGRNKD